MSRLPVALLVAGLVTGFALLGAVSPVGAAYGTPSHSPGALQPVPVGFVAQSVAAVGLRSVRVLGYAPCGTKRCSEVVGTDNGGKNWGLLGTIPGPIASLGRIERPGLTEIRFATPDIGWAFGSALFRTTDGGRSWRRQSIPGDGLQILDLASNDSETFAYVSACAWANGCQEPSSLWHAPVGGGTWSRIPLELPASPEFLANHYGADIAVSGAGIYVVDTSSEPEGGTDRFYASSDGGETFSPRPVPCEKSPHPGPHWLTGVVATSPKTIELLCGGSAGAFKSEKSVFRSSSGGRTATYAGTLPVPGLDSQLAASPSGTLAVASSSNGSFIYLNDSGRRTWTMRVAYSDGGRGWNDIAFVTDRVGWVVYSPADYFSGIGKLFVTRDGGKTWYLASRVTPH